MRQGQVELQPILVGSGADAATNGRNVAGRQSFLGGNPVVRSFAKNLSWICLWYLLSTLLSLWNKKLFGKEHNFYGKGPFPAPLFMTSVQFALQWCWACVVLKYYSTKKESAEPLDWNAYRKTVLPNGISTGMDIGLSNLSLSLITLSFYTMCKSTTPIFLLAFAFLFRLERPSCKLAGVVAVIALGLLLLVFGETKFNLPGFLLVMTASCLSGFRWTITQILLHGKDDQGVKTSEPIEVLYQLTPVMSVTVGVMSLAAEKLWITLPACTYFASWPHIFHTVLIFLIGSTLAFFMVWTEFKVIRETSALTFMVAGTFKEVVTVMAAVSFLGETFTFINVIGLAILICGVALFNYHKYTANKTNLERRPHEESDVEEGSAKSTEASSPLQLSTANYRGSDHSPRNADKRADLSTPKRLG